MLKCTRAPGGQPATRRLERLARRALAIVLVPATLAGAALDAQATAGPGAGATVTAAAELFATPGNRPLATVRRGAAIPVDTVRGTFARVTLEGWVPASLLGAARDSFPLTVRSGTSARLRASATSGGAILADLRGGMGLEEVRREGTWVRVRRQGWIHRRVITSAASSASSPSATAAAADSTSSPQSPPAPITEPRDEDGTTLTPTVETPLAASPDGERIGALAPGARASITGREKGWVRVRVEGWARERDFSVADSGLRGSLSAADLRADPEATRGRLVHWNVLILAHQTADPLRRGLENGEPYLLAQGPGRENALLYLAIPPALVATARDIPDLAQVTVTARVRDGRSEPVGVPVLELLTLVRR